MGIPFEKDDDLLEPYPGLPVLVYIAMSEEQAKLQDKPRCIEPPFPESGRVYQLMMDIPPELCYEKQGGWEKIVRTDKNKLQAILKLWYPNGVGKWDYRSLLNQIVGEDIWIIGFDD